MTIVWIALGLVTVAGAYAVGRRTGRKAASVATA